MKQIKSKQNQHTDASVLKGGYSGTGMLPFYAVFTTAIFLLAPLIGLGWSAVLFFGLGILTASMAQKYFTEKVVIDIEARNVAFEHWLKGDVHYSKMPTFNDFRQVIPSRFSQWYTSHTDILSKKKVALRSKKTPTGVRVAV